MYSIVKRYLNTGHLRVLFVNSSIIFMPSIRRMFCPKLASKLALLWANKLLSDKDRMLNFEPGEYMRKMIFQSVTQMARKNH